MFIEKKEQNVFFLEGVEAARNGKSINDCPYQLPPYYSDLRYHYWQNGFRVIKNDAKTSVSLIFQVVFGGPPERDLDIVKIKEVGRDINYECRGHIIPPGDWYNPENYPQGSKNVVFQEHLITSGVYDVTGIPYHYLAEGISLHQEIGEDGLKFVQDYGKENIYIAHNGESCGIFLFASKPRRFLGNQVGHNGNDGICAIFENCPFSILVI